MNNYIEYVVVLPYAVDKPTESIPLVLKNKPLYMAGMLNLPGGKIEDGETPIEAAERELLEESGLEAIGEYDGMCPVESEYMGKIVGNVSLIHCVRVPICSRQELKPRVGETELIDWFFYPELFNCWNLMPNLRITIPLMMKGVKGWTINDVLHTWRESDTHEVILSFDDQDSNPITINVRAVGYFKRFEEEE